MSKYEYELTRRVTPDSLIFYYEHLRTYDPENIDRFKYYVEATHMSDKDTKLVQRFFSDDKAEVYQKVVKKKIIYGFNDAVYKESIETPVTVTTTIATNVYHVCQRMYIPQTISVNGKQDNLVFEMTIKLVIPSIVFKKENKTAEEWFGKLVTHKAEMARFKKLGMAAIEFKESKPSPCEYFEFFPKLLENDLKMQYTGAKSVLKKHLTPHQHSLFYYLSSIKPTTIDPCAWRKLQKTKEIILHFSQKIDGMNSLAFVNQANRIVTIITEQGIYCIEEGKLLFPDDIAKIILSPMSCVMKGIIKSKGILHGELVLGKDKSHYAGFAWLEWTSPKKLALMCITESLPAHFVQLFMPVLLFKKTQFGSFQEAQENSVPVMTDGIIISITDKDRWYTKIDVYKIKPRFENTIDLLKIENQGYHTLKNQALMPLKMHILNVMPWSRKLEFEKPNNEPDDMIYETSISFDSDPGKYPTLKVNKIREDKLYPNSAQACAASFIADFLIRWDSLFMDPNMMSSLSFSGVAARSDERFNLSKHVFSVLDKMLGTQQSMNILDLGGGKQGYIKILKKHGIAITGYVNFDLSPFDLGDGLMRCSDCKDEGDVSLFKNYYVFQGDFSSMASLIDFDQNYDGPLFTTVLSIFALHYAFGSEECYKNLAFMLKKKTDIGCMFCCISYDYQKIYDALSQFEDINDSLDLGVVKFFPSKKDGIVRVWAEFGGDDLFEEPTMFPAQLKEMLRCAGFQNFEKTQIQEVDGLADLGKIVSASGYINLYTAVKMS